MRVADKMAFNQVNSNLAKNRAEMSELQNQAATQKRVIKPSDDPTAASKVLTTRIEEKGIDQYLKTSNTAKSFLEFADQSLAELTESLVRAKELALSQSSDAGSNQQSRRVTAAEVEQIFNQAVQIGNRKLGDRYVFAGHKTLTVPFDNEGEYQGDDGDIKVQINKDAYVAINLPGDKIFLGRGIGRDGFIRPKYETPKTSEELKGYIQDEQQRTEFNQEQMETSSTLRGPASNSIPGVTEDVRGNNIFGTLKKLENSLNANDKFGIQDSINTLDEAINQVIFARSQLGARVSLVNSTVDTLQKSRIDNKTMASQLEDVDAFQVISDINRNESALKATLETSGKLIQPSLLDFLR